MRRRRPASSVTPAAAWLTHWAWMSSSGLPERAASARPLWQRVASVREAVCVENIHRNWRYSLNYYSVAPLPDCEDGVKPFRIQQPPGRPPFVNGLVP